MNIATRVEGARGCGYRKEGGLYMVTDGQGEHCPKLPIELRVCPCCGGGFKPNRGWTWIEPGKLSPPEPHGTEAHAARCPLTLGIERAGLIWIGEAFYSPGSFSEEAARMGVSRRIRSVPREFELGVTWVFCAHRKASWEPCSACGDKVATSCEECDGAGRVPVPAAFYLFRPQRIEYVVKEDDDEEKLARLEQRGITLVRVVRAEEQAALT